VVEAGETIACPGTHGYQTGEITVSERPWKMYLGFLTSGGSYLRCHMCGFVVCVCGGGGGKKRRAGTIKKQKKTMPRHAGGSVMPLTMISGTQHHHPPVVGLPCMLQASCSVLHHLQRAYTDARATGSTTSLTGLVTPRTGVHTVLGVKVLAVSGT
jgi:hypothetical protein